MTHSTTCATLVRNGSCTCPPAVMRIRATFAWCPTCGVIVTPLPNDNEGVTISQLILAEQQHRETAHPAAEPDYQGVHDAVGGEDE